MGHPELIAALRAAAEERAAAIREEARADAERYRAEIAQKTAVLRAEALAASTTEAAERLAAATAEADREASRIVLAARAALAERLWRLARAALPQFRDERNAATFAALADELPDRAWPRVRVNPADRDLAGRRFPDAEVVPDEAIAAGLIAEADDGRIRVDNSLEKRLARDWPRLLPGLVGEILEEPGDHRAAS